MIVEDETRITPEMLIQAYTWGRIEAGEDLEDAITQRQQGVPYANVESVRTNEPTYTADVVPSVDEDVPF